MFIYVLGCPKTSKSDPSMSWDIKKIQDMSWQSYAFMTVCMGMKKLQKLDELKKFAILKKGIGFESQNLCKQFNDQKITETR